MRLRGVGGWLVAIAVIASGCTSGGQASVVPAPAGSTLSSSGPVSGTSAAPSTNPTTAPPTTAGRTTTSTAPRTSATATVASTWTTLWTMSTPQPLGQPEVVGRNVVLYTQSDSVLYLQVVDPATGHTRWRAPASAGYEAGGVEIQPTVQGTSVVYIAPDQATPQDGRIVVADGATGRVLARTAQVYSVDSRPRVCGTVICFAAWTDNASHPFRMNPATGAVASDPTPATDGRELYDQRLVSVHKSGQPELLVGSDSAGHRLFSERMDQVFGPGFTSDWGWTWHVSESDHLWYGAVGLEGSPTATAWATGQDRMWGVDMRTGKVRWTAPNTSQWCVAGLSRFDLDEHVRCHYSPGATLKAGIDAPLTGTVAVEGFDVRTGKATWSVPLPTGLTWEKINNAVRRNVSGGLVVQGAHGAVTVDLTTGRTAVASPDIRTVCIGDIGVPLFGQPDRDSDGTEDNEHGTGTTYQICDVSGRPVTQTRAWPADIGVTVGDIQLVTTPKGLQAGTSRAGATPVPSPTAPATPTTVPTPATLGNGPALGAAWTAHGFTPLTQPVLAGGLALLYGDIGDQFSVVAVDPASGTVRWSQPASGGSRNPSSGLAVAAVGDHLVYLRGQPGQTAHIVVADAATGRDIAATSGFYDVTSLPSVCGSDVCLATQSSDGAYLLTVEPTVGLIAVDRPTGLSFVQDIAPGLYLTHRDGTAYLTAPLRNSDAVQAPVTTLLPSGKSVQDGALLGSSTSRTDVLRTISVTTTTGQLPLVSHLGSEVGLIGVSRTTGKLVWSGAGTDDRCLPWSVRSSPVPVRCRWATDASESYEDGTWVGHHLAVTLEGYDPDTGRTTWTLPLPDATTGSTPTGGLVDQRHAVLTGVHGPVTVDLTTGRTGPASAGPVLCTAAITGRTGYVGQVVGGGDITQWDTGASWGWCGADGKTAAAAVREWPGWVGVGTGTVRVVLTPAGLQGFRQP